MLIIIIKKDVINNYQTLNLLHMHTIEYEVNYYNNTVALAVTVVLLQMYIICCRAW